MLLTTTEEFDGFSVSAVIAEPGFHRRDRRLIQVFVNKRRIQEYALVQAVLYGFSEHLPGGSFPAAFIFIDIDPQLVDFNIHPAKREVRIRTLADVRARVIEVLRSFLRAYTIESVRLERELWRASGRDETRSSRSGDSVYSPRDRAADRAASAPAPFRHERRAVAETPPDGDNLLYVGTLFETFVIVERDDVAYVIDQHAAHERILYNRFSAARSAQGLLVAEEFSVTEDQDRAIEAHVSEYGQLGITLERAGDLIWRITALPPEYRGQTEDIIETITGLGGLAEEFERTFLAEIACKAAVRAGDYIDELSALDLARRTLALPVPRCPHGRPLWVELDRERLEKLIGRR
jgi:DNA mismatch repair protein MutL